MAGMLSKLQLTLDGQHHSGLDDCRNITKIVVKMVEMGCLLDITGERDYSQNQITAQQNSGRGRGGGGRGREAGGRGRGNEGSGRDGRRGRGNGSKKLV